MNMQAFYERMAVKPEQPHERRLAGLARLSRAQILDATSDLDWLIWKAETPSVY